MDLSVAASFLAVVVAGYAVFEATRRDYDRWGRERMDRRRERLVGLYAEWSSRMMDLMARKQQADGIGDLAAVRADAISGPDTLALLERVFQAQREVNRAAIAIALEEGQALATDVENLSRSATAWDGRTTQTIHDDMERVLQTKRVSLEAMG